jgi:flap endonuclease-1
MGVALKDLIVADKIELKDLAGKTIAVDSFMWLYQFLSSIRASDGTLFTDSRNHVTSHLIGLSSRIPKLMQSGIRLAFVFDGQPPELKMHERIRRKEIKIEAESKYKEATEKEDIAGMKKYAAMTSRINQEMIDDAVELINAFGLPVIQAASEAEAQAAYLVKKDEAYAVASNDYDSLLFGAPRIVRNLNIVGKRRKLKGGFETVTPELLHISDVLNHLGIDQDQMIALGMLIGTDYNIGGIKGIGPKGALKLVKEHKDLDVLFKKVEWENYFDYPWTEVFYLIKKMPVSKEYELSWKKMNENKIKEVLIDKHDFSEERVAKIIEGLSEVKLKQEQKGLGQWF